ncbi:MAG: hypothetical protein H6600_04395 [Flavobacteriales bacterium]|nr:hypothetical protein [Flavobacteriales bacterium]
MLNKFIFIILFSLTIVKTSISQVSNKEPCYSKWYFPSEIKLGGIYYDQSIKGAFYLSYYFTIYENANKLNRIISGFAYNRMGKNDCGSVYLGYTFPTDHWFDLEKNVKIEPQYNFSQKLLDYVNIEFGVSWFAAISTYVGIPSDLNMENTSVGLKIGYYIPYSKNF